MKKSKYILIYLIIITIFQFALITTSFGVDNTENTSMQADASSISDVNVYSPSCILIDSSTGKILYEKNSNEVRYPASTTKIMTAILTLENCELTDVAVVSENAISSIPEDYVMCNISVGEELTVEQLLNVLLVVSANDAAVVLAEHISGSVEEFANLMNEKAKEIGCQNTHFVNPNGIHDDDHVSTAYDLALMARYAMKNPTFREIVKKTKYTLPATNKYEYSDRTFTTTNNLLIKTDSYYYADTTGVKTGYTEQAGNCLVSSAKKDNMEIISVVLGCGFTDAGLSEKFLDSITLLDYGFNNYSIKTIQEKNNVIQEVKVFGATKETQNLKVAVKDNIDVLLEKDVEIQDLEPEINIDKLKAPISAGSTIGSIVYNLNGEIYSSELIAQNDIEKSDFLPILLRFCLIIITLYLIYILLKPKKDHFNKKGALKK